MTWLLLIYVFFCIAMNTFLLLKKMKEYYGRAKPWAMRNPCLHLFWFRMIWCLYRANIFLSALIFVFLFHRILTILGKYLRQDRMLSKSMKMIKLKASLYLMYDISVIAYFILQIFWQTLHMFFAWQLRESKTAFTK